MRRSLFQRQNIRHTVRIKPSANGIAHHSHHRGKRQIIACLHILPVFQRARQRIQNQSERLRSDGACKRYRPSHRALKRVCQRVKRRCSSGPGWHGYRQKRVNQCSIWQKVFRCIEDLFAVHGHDRIGAYLASCAGRGRKQHQRKARPRKNRCPDARAERSIHIVRRQLRKVQHAAAANTDDRVIARALHCLRHLQGVLQVGFGRNFGIDVPGDPGCPQAIEDYRLRVCSRGVPADDQKYVPRTERLKLRAKCLRCAAEQRRLSAAAPRQTPDDRRAQRLRRLGKHHIVRHVSQHPDRISAPFRC